MSLATIFCLPQEVTIDDLSESAPWAYENPKSETVLILTDKQVQEYESMGLWRVISEVTDEYLFGHGEEDYIFDINHLQSIKEKLMDSRFKYDANIKKIVSIIDYALNNNITPVVFFI